MSATLTRNFRKSGTESFITRSESRTKSSSTNRVARHGLHRNCIGQAWAQHTEAMDPSAQGRYAGAVGGQDARQARAGSRELGDPVERFAKPLLHLDTPTSAAWVTPASIHLFSGQDHSFSAQGDVHLTAVSRIAVMEPGMFGVMEPVSGC